MFVPRTFALHEDLDHRVEPAIIGWGMTLPDGSAIAVDWRHGPSSQVTVGTDAERIARLHSAELHWTDHNNHERTPH